MIDREIEQSLRELLNVFPLSDKHLCVFGVSTSEVLGKQIGMSGSEEIAQKLFEGIYRVQQEYGFQLAFQCCEHLNRACVVTQQTANFFGFEQVAAVPVPSAGGAMATYAYQHLLDAICVETIQADAGVDIGDTLIGMHLKPVAVPLRIAQQKIGAAHLKMAYSRPKYIGGARTVYTQQKGRK